MWLFELFTALAFEYHWRYGRDHNVFIRLGHVLENPPKNIPEAEWIDPPQAMPEQYQSDDVVESYRNFYRLDKLRFAKWDGKVRDRTIPNWF
jgi:hypothetical protein